MSKELFVGYVCQYLSVDTKRSFLLQLEKSLYVYLSLRGNGDRIAMLKKLSIDVMYSFQENLSILHTEQPTGFEDLPECCNSLRTSVLSLILISPGFVRPYSKPEQKQVNLFLAETVELEKALIQRSVEKYEKAVVVLISNLKNQDDYDLFSSLKQYLGYSIVGLCSDVFRGSHLFTADEWKRNLLRSRSYDELSESLLAMSSLLEDFKQQFLKLHSVELIERIKYIFKENLYDINLSSTFVADMAGLSLGYTRNLFKSYEGISLNDYIGLNRIEEACVLLVTSEKSINEIRELLGFGNTSYFCTYSKKLKTVSPSVYSLKNITPCDTLR